tara:strand:+ start:1177 stop:1947 length:771 start_codon:yes stop_codon:yes gene_type:complete
MKTADLYEQDKSFALLLIAPPKSGKTVLGLSFPDPYVLDCDNNLAGALRYHNFNNKPFRFWFDDPNEVPVEKRWAFCMEKLAEAVKDPDVKTIFVDGLALMGYYLEQHILANSNKGTGGMADLVIAGEKVMNMSQWGPFKNLMSKLVMGAKSSGKLFVMSCHEQAMTNDKDSVIAYVPLISGSLRNNIAGFFTDVWRCETSNKATGPEYSVRFAPKSLMQIGNSLNIKETSFVTSGKTREQIWEYLAPKLGISPTK